MLLTSLLKHQLYTSASEALLLDRIEVNRIFTEDISVPLSQFRALEEIHKGVVSYKMVVLKAKISLLLLLLNFILLSNIC